MNKKATKIRCRICSKEMEFDSISHDGVCDDCFENILIEEDRIRQQINIISNKRNRLMENKKGRFKRRHLK